MPRRRSPQIHTRKDPQQARSNQLVSAVLTAAIQVLAKEGAPRFTMARVAKKAGVSVGSLYQYFPNKAAILFRLQTDEWRQTSEMLGAILDDRSRPALERMRAMVHAFVRSECDEAAVRLALHDAAPLYRDAPDAIATRDASEATMRRFLAELLPSVTATKRALAGDLLATTLSATGKKLSEDKLTPAQILASADALADMFAAYLKSLR